MTEADEAAPLESAPALDTGTVEIPQAANATPATAGAEDDSPPSADEKAVAWFDGAVEKTQGTNPNATPEEEPEKPVVSEQEMPETSEPTEPKTDDLSQTESSVSKPFIERPEWKNLTKLIDPINPEAGKELRRTLRGMMERENGLANELKTARPAVQTVEQLRQVTGGTEIAIKNTIAFFRQFNDNPRDAVPFLEKILADARHRAGLVVTSPDLKNQLDQVTKEMEEGIIPPEKAVQRQHELVELETHRAAVRRIAQQTEANNHQLLVRQTTEREQAELTEIDQAETTWTSGQSKADPDFAILKPTFDKFAQLEAIEFRAKNGRLPNRTEALKILEKAYGDAKVQALKLQPRRKAITPVRDEGISRHNRPHPVTEQEKFEARFEKALNRT
jgi:hypothetical protein